jgi:hypothetical protein
MGLFLPAEHIEAEPKKVAEMSAGDTAYISWASITVTPEGKTFVEKKASLSGESGFYSIKIRRVPEGIVLTLPQKRDRLKGRPHKLWIGVEYLPVVQILEEEDVAEDKRESR